MALASRNRPVLILYLLGAYIVLQFAWWAYLLIDTEESRTAMVIGEGSVFLFLLLFGMYRLKRSFDKEIALAEQERNFMMAVTHELRSPITSVKLFLQTLRRMNEDPDQVRLADNAIGETDRLNGLIDNILLASRIESKGFSLSLQEEDVAQQVRSALKTPSESFGAAHQTVFDLHEGVRARLDAEALRSVLVNLYENAIKYSPEGSQVLLSVGDENGMALIRIEDQGSGIPVSERSKVLEKFYRSGEESQRKSKGTGLGLYIVDQLVRMQNGSFRLKGGEKGGTIAEISFPQA